MSLQETNPASERPKGGDGQVLELRVNNHPGVMSHICGLFTRRSYNMEKILCLPMEDGEQSRIWLTVKESDRLDQVIKQVMKLEDVLDVTHRGTDQKLFNALEAVLGPPPPGDAGDVRW